MGAITGVETRVRVFGGIGVEDADGPVSIGGPKQQRLLALLAVRVGQVVSVDWLAEYLWDDGERPNASAPAIRTYLSRLRQALPEEAQQWIETEQSGYRLAAPPEAVEHRRFALLRAEATIARELDDPLTAHNKLDEALALWRGEPFPELENLDWARADIEQIRLDRLEMFEERWEAALALGRHTQITGELAAFAAEHGNRDRAAQQHAMALHRSGRTAEALRVVADHRRRLADESGLDPSAGMVALERALFDGDPSLHVEKVGRPLRGYRLLEEAGSGAFSIVWRGEQPSVHREVAIKQIRSELASQPEFIRRFEAEAHMVARLEHPHIIPLIDYWRDPDSAYLVMRWLSGGTLERRLDDGSLSLDETKTLARQIGGALSTAHAQGIVHRDVKTANVLFDDQGNAFLGDFGIALEATESAGPEAALSPGSPVYASPEQLRRERLGPEADIFSLGVVIFECLTGSVPFPATSSVEELIDRQLNMAYPSLAELRADIPQAVSDAVAKATAKEPSERFASIAEFVAALDTTTQLSDAGALTDISGQAPIIGELANPYLGLRAFDEGDADRFFGRDRLVTEIVGRLAGDAVGSRCVVVVGPSGSGKSSVVRAGLIPRLRDGVVEGSSDWFTTTMVPGDDPFESLEAALLRIAVNPPPTLLDQLRDGPRGILRSVRRCLGAESDHLLLVIDQFEEVFVGKSADQANRFLEALAVAVDDPASPLRLVATLRADYYHRPLEHPLFAPVLTAGSVDVVPLAADEIERAIVEPAAQLGVGFEPGLVTRIAAEAVGQPSPLPLLQYTLGELFDRRAAGSDSLTIASYDELGGLSGALSARAESIHAVASEPERQAIRRIFGAMTNPGEGTTDLRRRVTVPSLGDDPATAWVLDQFAAARLITFDKDVASREPTVEVAHEALLREWPRLVGWLEEDREILHAADLVSTAASIWDRGGLMDADLYRGGRLDGAIDLAIAEPDRLRPLDSQFIDASRAAADAGRSTEQQRLRRLRRLVTGVAAALVVALVAGGIAWSQQRRAAEQADVARAAADDAEAQTALAVAASNEAELATLISRSASLQVDDRTQSLLLALEANRRSPGRSTELAVLDALSASTGASVTPSLALDPTWTSDCPARQISEDGTQIFEALNDRLMLYDLASGEVTDSGAFPLPSADGCGAWILNPETGQRVVGAGPETWSVGSLGGPDVQIEADGPMFVVSRSIVGNRLVFVESGTYVVRDATTGEVVTEVERVNRPRSVTTGGNGSLIGMTRGLLNGSGEAVLLDAQTGGEVWRVEISASGTESIFDQDSGEMLIATADGLITIDVELGEVVAEVETTATSEVLGIGIRPDGLVVIATEGQIETVDRRLGPTGVAVPISEADDLHVRSDGSVVKIDFGGRTQIIDLEGAGFATRLWDIPEFGFINMADGKAASVNSATGDVNVIDLDTGERRSITLVKPAGFSEQIAAAEPRDGGFITFTLDGAIVSLWDRDGNLLESVRTGSQHDFEGIGGFFPGERGANIVERYDGSTEVALVAVEPELSVLQHVDAPDAASAIPAPDDGVYVIDEAGVFRSYDKDGEVVDEIDTGVAGMFYNDQGDTGLIALAGTFGGVLIDPETGTVDPFPTSGRPSSLDLIRNDELLLISGSDGTISVWDVESGEPGGVVWRGTGSNSQGGSYYDEATESLWVASSGKLVELPMNPQRWLGLACEAVDRDFTQDEWDRLVPGDDPIQSACS